MPITFSTHDTVFDGDLKRDIAVIAELVMGSGDTVFDYLGEFKNPSIVMARDGARPVGFKIGFQYNKKLYYSWLGGVDPEYRGQGIARRLMDMQHDWVRQQGYKMIETRTQNKYKPMLMLNIISGFDVVGTIDDEGTQKIVMRKML